MTEPGGAGEMTGAGNGVRDRMGWCGSRRVWDGRVMGVMRVS